MPITLTAAHKGYTEVKAVQIRIGIQRKQLFIVFEYGDTVDGKWVAGHIQQEEKLIRNVEQVLDGEGGEVRAADPQYDLLIAGSIATAADGFNCYVATARNIYEHAIAEGWFDGEAS